MLDVERSAPTIDSNVRGGPDPVRPSTRKGRAGRSENSAKSADRVLNILRCFNEQSESLTFQELVARTRIPRSSIYRFLNQLVRQRFLVELAERDHRVYAIGPTIVALGKIGLGEAMLRRYAYPTMQVIAEKTGESVYLSVRHGDQSVCVENIDAVTPLRYGGRVGYVYPLHAGCSKVILAYLETSLRDHIVENLNFRTLTKSTINSRAKLMRRLATIRQRGYEVSTGEIFPGTKAVGAPIFDSNGSACAVISVGAPEHRINTKREAILGRLVIGGAKEISARVQHKS
jgi:DNA-binding IclR family transcriptional regulator